MTCGPTIVFTRKTIVDQTYISNSSNVCKTIDGIDAGHLFLFSICQKMPTGHYKRSGYDSKTDRFKATNNRTRNFENLIISFFQELRPECKIESFFTSGRQ